ncbi:MULTISPECIES: hypothetical protein [unclassified Schlesneria]|uniref:hypothetical protein n=1 Tax=Schlesneria TaxID=656899 RepID=UPI00359F8FFD
MPQSDFYVKQYLTAVDVGNGKFRLIEGKHTGLLTWIFHPKKSTPVLGVQLKSFFKSIKKPADSLLTSEDVDAFFERLEKAGYRRTYAAPDKLYHVTHPDSVPAILKDGLIGGREIRNRGHVQTPSIYTVVKDDESLLQNLVINQIWTMQDVVAYSVLEIDGNGITGDVIDDAVAEESSFLHRVIEQALIEPQYLKLLRTCTINFPGKKVWELNTPEKLESKEPWTDEDWAIARKWLGPENHILEMRRQIEDRHFSSKSKATK